MFLCVLTILSAVLASNDVRGECTPTNRQIDNRETALNSYVYVFCYISSTCDNSQSFIFHKCDLDGENCRKACAYSFINNSVSDFGILTRPIQGYYSKGNYYRIDVPNGQITDEGIWKCYITSTGSEYEGTISNMTIYVRPSTNAIRLTPFRKNVPANKKFNLTCLVDGIRPAYRFYFEVNGVKFRHGIQVDTPNVNTWNLTYTVELVMSPVYLLKGRCIVQHKWGHAWMNSDYFVINPIQDNPLAFYPSEEVIIGCVVPITFTWTGWSQNENPISSSRFYNETRSEVKGIFDFIDPDETTAMYSELKFVLPGMDEGCDVINEYSAIYECEAENIERGYTYMTKPLPLEVSYPPILESTLATRNSVVYALPKASLVLVCQLCSYPSIENYKWQRGNVQLGSSRTFIVPDVTENDFGEYICIASNTIGTTNVTLNVKKKVGKTITFYQAGADEQITMECPLCDGSEQDCKWEINDELVHNERSYTIQNLREAQYGDYLCFAIFAVGRTWMRIRLAKPGTTDIGANIVDGTDGGTSAVGEADRTSSNVLPSSQDQAYLLFTTEVIAGLSVAGAVIVGMIVTIIVLCCILVRRRQPKEKVKNDVSEQEATTSQETASHYEKINPAYKH